MCVEMTLDPLISPCSVSDNTTGTLVHPENQPHPYHSSTLRLVPKTITVPEAKLLSSWYQLPDTAGHLMCCFY